MFFTAPYRNALQRFDQPFAAAIAQDVAKQVAHLAKQIKTDKKKPVEKKKVEDKKE